MRRYRWGRDEVRVSMRDLAFVLNSLQHPNFDRLWAALDKGGVGSQVRVALERLRQQMEEEERAG